MGGNGGEDSVTRRLAEYAANLRYEDLPGEVVNQAKLCILDAIACGVFGSRLAWSKKIQQVVDQLGGKPQATVWGTALRTSATGAALCNGTACHGFEFDDIYDTAYHHPGAVVVPAALAVAEMRGGTTGRQFLQAVTAAYEVSGRIGRALGQSIFFRGFHGQGVHGCMAAAVAAGKICGLSADEMRHALGIAGSQAAGLMAAQEGAMVKRMHSGRACQSGVLSALLAATGFTGIPDVLEAKFGGYASSFGGLQDPAEALFCGDMDRYMILDVGFKVYPAAAGTHCAIQAVEAMVAENQIDTAAISEIEVYTSTMNVRHCGWPYQGGRGITEAQMNIAYALAAVLLHRALTPEAYSPEALADPRVVGLASRVQVFSDPEIDSGGHEMRHAARVQIRLMNGSTLSRFEPYRKGSKRNPVSPSDLLSKFGLLVGAVLGDERRRQLQELLLDLEVIADMRQVAWLLGGP